MSDGDNKNDLTRIEDLSEFLHQGDDELDKLLADLDESNEDSSSDEDEAEIELAPFDYSTNSQDDSFDNEEDNEEDNYDNYDSSDSSDSYDEAEYAFDDQEGPEQGIEEDNSFSNYDNNEFEEDDQNNFNEDFNEDFNESDDQEDDQTDNEDNAAFFESDFDEISDDEQDSGDESALGDADNYNDSNGLTEENEQIEEAEIELSPIDEYESADQEELESEAGSEIAQDYQRDEGPLTATAETVRTEIKKAQDFSEVKDFATNSTYGKVAIGGNPPFSILMQGIIPGEYDESILAILNEHGLLADNEELYRTSLESGQLLIAQIGEFSAIYLAGKLRRYCRVIKLGLAHEIHASPNYDHSDQRGLTGPRSINQNQSKHFIRSDREFNQEDILLSSSHFIPGYLITHSLGPMQINEVIDGNEFNDIKSINLIEYFSDLFKESAYKKGANAIISIHFTINQQGNDSSSNNIIIMAHGDYVILEENKA